MPAVLGIDAAWTEREPTGVALISDDGDGWRCVALAPSYEAFIGLASGFLVDWDAPMRGAMPEPAVLLNAASRLLGGQPVDVVAVDMPVSMAPITARRAADSAVAREFGGRGCGTHSPSAERPGPVSARLSDGFAEQGYPLATATTPAGAAPCLIEVYPHPALLALLRADYRVPYKVSKARKLWPGTTPAERREKLLEAFAAILAALGAEIRGIPMGLPEARQVTTSSRLKRYEDALDALVCAWVGSRYLQGMAKPYGDDTAAIWIPQTSIMENGDSSRTRHG